MILINENKIRVGAFGNNTEKILIFTSKMSFEKRQNKNREIDNILLFDFDSFNFDKLLVGIKEQDNIKLLDRIQEVFIPNGYEINPISAEKLLVKKIISELNLKEKIDFKHISGFKWLHDDMNVRVTIPSIIIPENPNLIGLIDHVKGLIDSGNAYKYKASVLFIFYFRDILPEHLDLLEKEIDNILIENKI